MYDRKLTLLESLRTSESVLDPIENETSWRVRIAWMLAIIVGAVVAFLIHSWMPLHTNVTATRAVQSISAPGLKEFLRLVSGFGNAPKVVAITVVVLLAFNRRSEAFFLSFSGLGAWLAAMELKVFFATPRPTPDLVAVFHQWPNGSFPSGHLAFYVCYFGFLYLIARDALPLGSKYRQMVLILLALMIVLVGFSRVYLGEHWVSDLAGSYLLGFIWLAISVKFYRVWMTARDRRRRLALGVAAWN